MRPGARLQRYENIRSRISLGRAGARTINGNEGTLKGGGKTGGARHDKNGIYLVLQGEARLRLDDEVRRGSGRRTTRSGRSA
jgi:hypothetical protein